MDSGDARAPGLESCHPVSHYEPAEALRQVAPPTLFVDEADALFGTKRAAEQNEDLRALFNAGFQRGRPTLRCVGPRHEVGAFNTFAMAALAAIKGLPDTITDRAVHIVLQRRRPTDQVSSFRLRRDRPALQMLRADLATWVREKDRLERLGEVEPPNMPVEDRAADAWEPLIAIADEAQGDWPRLAREACKALSAEADEAEVDQTDILLIRDIDAVFTGRKAAFLGSQELVDGLREIKDSPWGDWELTPSKLAHRLKPYGVRPGHDASGDRRGYQLQYFWDLFARYGRQNASTRQKQAPEQREQGEKEGDDHPSEGCQSRQNPPPQTSTDSLANCEDAPKDAGQGGSSDTLTASGGTPAGNGTTAPEQESPRPSGTPEDFDRLRRDPGLKTDTNPVPAGGLTNLTPGLTDRVQRALTCARATKASADTNGQATGTDLTVERELDGSKQEG